jgi:hypothetical protein
VNPLETAIAAAKAGRGQEAQWFLREAVRVALPSVRQRIVESFDAAVSRFRKPGERGTGDTLARLAKPVADAIQAVTGKPCGGCQERQQARNEAHPYGSATG